MNIVIRIPVMRFKLDYVPQAALPNAHRHSSHRQIQGKQALTPPKLRKSESIEADLKAAEDAHDYTGPPAKKNTEAEGDGEELNHWNPFCFALGFRLLNVCAVYETGSPLDLFFRNPDKWTEAQGKFFRQADHRPEAQAKEATQKLEDETIKPSYAGGAPKTDAATATTMPIATEYRSSSRAVGSRAQPIPVDETGWPIEKWKGSPEELSRKQGAIAQYLLRVWKTFVEETGALVSRQILAEKDPAAASALRGYLTYAPFPEGLPIYTSAELKRKLAERPITTKASSGRIAELQ